MYLLLGLVLAWTVANTEGQQDCWEHGNQTLMSGVEAASTARAFYLDVQNAAVCSGMLESIEYCYYESGGGRNQAFVGVYRPTTDSANVTMYTALSNPLMSLSTMTSFSNNGNLFCGSILLSSPISVSPGDVFGVCYDHMNVENNLAVVGVSSADSMLLTNSMVACDASSTVYTSSDLAPVSNRRMHVYGNFQGSTTESSTQGNSFLDSSTSESFLGSSISESFTTASVGVGRASDATGLGVGLFFAFLIVVAAVAIVITGGVYFFYLRKKRVESKTLNVNNTIDNCIYNEIGDVTVVGENYEEPVLSKSQVMGKADETSEYEDIPDGNENASNLYYSPNAVTGEAPTSVKVPTMSFKSSNNLSLRTRGQTTRLLQGADLIADAEENAIYEAPGTSETALYAQIERHDTTTIVKDELKFVSHLGSGNFGTVAKGVWKRHEREMVVAMKTLTEGDDEAKIKFLQEAVIMSQFKHPNVLLLHGICDYKDTVVIVMEFADKGDLRQHLLSIKNESTVEAKKIPKRLLSYSQHIALGMQYLSSKGFVHRDLAARNIFVTKDNTCKVADFGMSRDLFDENYYVSSGGAVPLKWTAPEAINYKKYSTASDVWSYGCVLYEIWSLGTKPYHKMQNVDVLSFVNSGKRLPPPPGCPRMIYQQMMLCWHPESGSRPTFQDILMTLVGSDLLVLQVPSEVGEENPEAAVIGAPIEAGSQMYLDLCNQYSS